MSFEKLQEPIVCKCGKEFNSTASYYGHKSWCVACVGEEGRNRTLSAHKGRHWKLSKPGWSKGLTKETDSRIANLSKAMIGVSTGHASTPEREAIRRLKLSEAAKQNGLGGYVPGSGLGNKGRYKGIWCDSSWELAYVIYNLDHDIEFSRNSKSFEYEYQGSIHKYTPDFICNGHYIEIKGRERPQDTVKYTAVKDLIVLHEAEMKPYLEYVIRTYGSDFIQMYE